MINDIKEKILELELFSNDKNRMLLDNYKKINKKK